MDEYLSFISAIEAVRDEIHDIGWDTILNTPCPNEQYQESVLNILSECIGKLDEQVEIIKSNEGG